MYYDIKPDGRFASDTNSKTVEPINKINAHDQHCRFVCPGYIVWLITTTIMIIVVTINWKK